MTRSTIGQFTEFVASNDSLKVSRFWQEVRPYLDQQTLLLYRLKEGSKPHVQVSSALERAQNLIPLARKRLGLTPESEP